jgi:hypothetical protein
MRLLATEWGECATENELPPCSRGPGSTTALSSLLLGAKQPRLGSDRAVANGP